MEACVLENSGQQGVVWAQQVFVQAVHTMPVSPGMFLVPRLALRPPSTHLSRRVVLNSLAPSTVAILLLLYSSGTEFRL